MKDKGVPVQKNHFVGFRFQAGCKTKTINYKIVTVVKRIVAMNVDNADGFIV